MSAARRLWWVVALGAVWPAWTVLRAFWHPVFSNDVGDVAAAITFGLLAALTLRTAALPNLRDWRRKREIRDLRDDVARLQRWQAAHEEQAAQKIAQLDCVTEGFTRVFGATSQETPRGWDANAPTDPRGLRRVV